MRSRPAASRTLPRSRNCTSDSVANALASLETEGLQDAATVVAFFSHVNAERGDKARAAGCRVLTRGSFVTELPGLLASAADSNPSMEDSKP